MRTGLTKKQKVTDLYSNEKDCIAEIDISETMSCSRLFHTLEAHPHRSHGGTSPCKLDFSF